ncbi:MAG: hypothetical protein CFE23_15550 [Flavobacterium sp. BFFFF1]|uniref:AAA family ATPase n=1 Tax=Flavobacterium sp. BFFFF1 TaxID=2015557 RepID=UPI000BC87CD5|nr:AAA family ATPase [Flavobacterium sp. BFFFF1]OYU79118.1 MAG: hypothetical protein CFE23_15550 [Flavobacterium sp. BFFFF1]
MEKLIVKNFGPIKEAEIELNKYVVFIGDTSTGKSVLAKLIAIFRDSLFSILGSNNENQLNFKDQLIKFNINFNTENTEISFYEDEIKLLFLRNDFIVLSDQSIKEDFRKEFKELHKESLKNFHWPKFLDFDEEQLTDYILQQTFSQIVSTYIPAERILVSLISNSISGLLANNVALPECYKEFAAKFEVSRKKDNIYHYKDFQIQYDFDNGRDNISVNNSKILLSEASSGIQSLIPMLLVLDTVVEEHSLESSKLLIIEEPELNLYPTRQKKIVDYFVGRIKNISCKLVITTHSPYILSSLDTLLLAKNTFNEYPDLKEEINAIVPESNWIDYSDLSVYEVRNDGTIKSIKNEEFKSIDTNAIDGVSDIISEEFDRLTELRYAQ